MHDFTFTTKYGTAQPASNETVDMSVYMYMILNHHPMTGDQINLTDRSVGEYLHFVLSLIVFF